MNPNKSRSPTSTSPTNKFKKQKSKTKTLQADPYPEYQQHYQYEERPGNVVYVDRIVEVKSRNPGHMKVVKVGQQQGQFGNLNDDDRNLGVQRVVY